MMWRWLPLLPALFLLSPGLLRAQAETKAFDPFKPYASNNGTMYEDIEIFRRILNRKLGPIYPMHTSTTFGMAGMQAGMGGLGGLVGGMAGMQGGMIGMQGGMARIQGGLGIAGGPIPVATPIRSLEGVYLKGQGVIYTATLSSLEAPAKSRANEWEKGLKLSRPVSEWESVRRQLHPAKEEPKKPEASKPPTLSDDLLKVLAENGYHFSQLGEDESLTIVLTAREPGRSRASRTATEKPAKTGSLTLTDSASSSIPSKVRDLELLGDLHQKQGHYEEALTAYQAAAAREPGPDPNEARKLYRKMAQCYLALGEDEKASKALGQALAHSKTARAMKDSRAFAAKPAPTPLPAKLIISAPKKLLVQVKEGKITFEEFRAKTHVETLRFGESRSAK